MRYLLTLLRGIRPETAATVEHCELRELRAYVVDMRADVARLRSELGAEIRAAESRAGLRAAGAVEDLCELADAVGFLVGREPLSIDVRSSVANIMAGCAGLTVDARVRITVPGLDAVSSVRRTGTVRELVPVTGFPTKVYVEMDETGWAASLSFTNFDVNGLRLHAGVDERGYLVVPFPDRAICDGGWIEAIDERAKLKPEASEQQTERSERGVA
ncbi:hypothetical protein PWY87_16255 [Kribbella solani]|uniref:hypothetical protein n=1 Tax=Kribbella solani TaxID=236067 RepID=UPI0029BE3A30|nr:hypothetical protein [Kribbella solani]MDX3003244.1 hypothetical protein [Kribbella solani]